MPRRRIARTTLAGLRAVGYFRVSTELQSERGVSLEVQADRYAAYVGRNGLVDVGTYIDVASGALVERPSYQRMLAAVRAGQVDVIVVMYLDRFGRDVEEAMSRWWELQRLGVLVKATDEQLEEGEDLPAIIKTWFAAEERRRIGQRSYNGRRKRAEESTTWLGAVPYGWHKEVWFVEGRRHQRLIIDEAAAAVVQRMARWYLDGLSVRAIAARLRDEGEVMPRGRPWTAGRVYVVLSRPHNAGDAVWDRSAPEPVVRRGVLPPILDAETAAAVVERLQLRATQRPRAVGSPHLLSGILRCGLCDGTLGIGYGGSTHRVRNYHCLSYTFGGGCEHRRHHNADKLEAAVLTALSALSDPAAAAAAALPAPAAERDYAAEMQAARATIAGCDQEFADNLRLYRGGVLSERQFAEANRSTEERRSAAERRLTTLDEDATWDARRLTRAQQLPVRLRSYLATVADAPVSRAKAELAALVARVTVWPDGRFTVQWRD